MPKLTFLGATGCVTGSKFLVEAAGERLLIDCGLFQGPRELRRRNWDPLPIAPASIHHVLLTHAHIDHTGYLPRLVRDGFKGRIYSNSATADLCKILLPDSARLQEEDAEHAAYKKFSKHQQPEPLYTEEQAHQALSRFSLLDVGQTSRSVRPTAAEGAATSAAGKATPEAQRSSSSEASRSDRDLGGAELDRPGGLSYIPIGRNFRARLHPAGHILGSSSIELHVTENGRATSILFSGDVGRYDQPILKDPAHPPLCDYVVCESTYGNREHPAESPLDALASALTAIHHRGGVAVIPAFAVGRTQTLLYLLRQLEEYQRIPKLPVYVDSPMAITATELYLRHRYDHDLAFQRQDAADGADDPLHSRQVHMTRSRDESRQINNVNFPAVIISASGMATGGRILYHLARRLPDSRNAVLLAGFQAHGTRGRALLEGARHLRIHGEDVPVKAQILRLSQFSAHAGRSELLRWLRSLAPSSPSSPSSTSSTSSTSSSSSSSPPSPPAPSPAPKRVFLVHGEPDAAAALRDAITAELHWDVTVPEYRSTVDL